VNLHLSERELKYKIQGPICWSRYHLTCRCWIPNTRHSIKKHVTNAPVEQLLIKQSL